ncbi:MAG: type I-C CRISPR-associated endonuclease Cas1c [Firmicutes bacterium]|nr:type I-C CRISPR-associated endonuclease Cas1c [Bacillota bacterium]
MRHLLNTLYILSEDRYLSLDGENVVVQQGGRETARFPLHGLEGIVSFAYPGASPALMGACAERGISLNFFTPHGRFLAGVHGEERGNVLLRRTQYRVADLPDASLRIARNFIIGKLFNSRWVLERATRDHAMRVDVPAIKAASEKLARSILLVRQVQESDSLRGLEGEAAAAYFGVWDEMILQNKEAFFFHERSRRPPLDRVNALLSLFYAMLASDCAAALTAAGLDPYVGFLHTDRPGRRSLALDLQEELRAPLVDRFVLSVINQRMIVPEQFDVTESGAVFLTDAGRKAAFAAWQNRKREELKHPFLQEKIPWGLVPYVQALLLARFLRGDLDDYPPFLWK